MSKYRKLTNAYSAENNCINKAKYNKIKQNENNENNILNVESR